MAQLPDIPGYRLLKVLKQSKRSRTYLAEQQSLARQVALKVLSEEFFNDPALRQRFVDEGKSAARLNHPHVLAVFDIGSAGGYPFIATEFVAGGTLRDRMQQPMAPVEALRITRDLATALDYAHAQGVIHRDIKPSNIMFRGDGAPVLGDLGILKGQSGATTSMQMGSPHYMSPEQIEGLGCDGRADLYSLGVVLFEMLTGRPPFDADDPYAVAGKHLSDPVPRLPEPLSLYQSLIDRTLAKKPEERYTDAREMVVALDGFLEPKTLREPRPQEAKRTATASRAAPADVQSPPTVVQPVVPPVVAKAAPPPRKPALQPTKAKANPLKALVRILFLLGMLAALGWGGYLLVQRMRQPAAMAPVAPASHQLAGTQAAAQDARSAEAQIQKLIDDGKLDQARQALIQARKDFPSDAALKARATALKLE